MIRKALNRYAGAWVAAALLAACPAGLNGQQPASGPRPYAIPPDVADAHYGPHARNVLDVWKAKTGRPAPVVVFIHGGGFVAGDKTQVPRALLNQCLESGIAVASINYRYSTIAPYPAPMADGARAVQFVRLHANEWNINPRAVAASGGSAGAGISEWIAFHDELANPKSGDPVERQSTRLTVIGVMDAQTSYDPRFIAKLVGEETARIPPLASLFGVPEGADPVKAEDKFRLYEEASPVTHLNAGDPPVFLYYSRELRMPPADTGEGIHSPQFGLYLKEKMDKLGIECVVRTPKDYGKGGTSPEMLKEMIAFFRKHFPKE
jgi:acetyl esterase